MLKKKRDSILEIRGNFLTSLKAFHKARPAGSRLTVDPRNLVQR